MKTSASIFILISICFVFGGCPYESKVPIDKPSIPVNPKLLGTWADHNNKEEIYTVSKKDNFTYSIIITSKEKDETENYFAYASVLKDITFLNIQKNKPTDSMQPFVIYKMEIQNDNLITLSAVTENIDEIFSSSQELKNYITSNMKNSYFYEKEETILVRPIH